MVVVEVFIELLELGLVVVVEGDCKLLSVLKLLLLGGGGPSLSIISRRDLTCRLLLVELCDCIDWLLDLLDSIL